MADDINYQAVAEQLQKELETARLTIVRMRYMRNPFDQVNGEAIRHFLEKHYVIIVLAFMLLSFIASFVKIRFTFSVQRSTHETS